VTALPDPRPIPAPPLGRHRLVGGSGLAALIDDDAVVDWWCHPGPDGPPQLWSLLDPHGGTARWWNATGVRQVGLPAGPSARTTVNIDGEPVACWDALVPVGGHPLLVRLVRSTTRPLGVTHELRAGGFDTAGGGDGGGGAATIDVTSTGAPPHHVDGSTFCSLELQPDRWAAVVIGSPDALPRPVDVPALVDAVHDAEARAQRLVDACEVVQAHRERVETSLLVLDACTDPVTGPVVPAPTESLPEVPGADRQFDYRFAWLRDASLAAGVAAAVGRADVTRQHIDWLTDRCLRCEGVPVPVVRASGDEVPDEREVEGVAGWGGAQPVRIGNAAKGQVQADGAGLAADAVWSLVRTGAGFDRDAYRALAGVADEVARRPVGAEHGIWELRIPVEGASADLGRWILFDRARRLSLVHEPWARGRRREWWRHEDAARRRLLGGRLPSGAVPLVYGRLEADAAGLLAVVLGLLDPRSPDAAALVEGTIAELGIGDPLEAIARYPGDVDDGFDGKVGGFVPVSWMAVSALAQIGRLDDADALADRLCRALPGLQPEVLDDGEPLGNLPLVWSHAEAARALYALRVGQVRRRFGRVGVGLWTAWRALRTTRRAPSGR
jgi:hypothetical protein